MIAVPDLRRIIAVLGAALASIVVLAACATDRSACRPRDFDNRTAPAVTVVWERAGGERVTLATLAAGGTSYVHVNEFGDPRDVCGDGDLVALDASGKELIRTPASCDRWVIRVPAVPTGQITDRTWVLTALVPPDGSPSAPVVPSTLLLSSAGDFTIRTGCRTLVGQWKAIADRVGPTTSTVADEPAATPCTGQAASQDADVTAILGTPTAVQLTGRSLAVIADYGDHRDWQLHYDLDPAAN